MRMGAALALLAAAGLPPAAAADAPRWRLGPGDVADFVLTPITKDAKTGERKDGKETSARLFGHAVSGGRLHLPRHYDFEDIPRLIALSLPGDAAGGEERLAFDRVTDCGPVQAAGKWEVAARPDGMLDLKGSFALRHRGPPKSDDFRRRVLSGTVEVVSRYDPAQGAVVEASYDLDAHLVLDDPRPKDPKIVDVRKTAELLLRGVRRSRDEGFQRDVDAAIERGVEWLKKQPKDGAYPEWGGYPGGTDALAALALYACDAERKAGDAALARAMRYMPEKTYQAAVTMLAIEMRHTAPGEAELLRAGKIDRQVRNLAADERGWMERGADFLMRSAIAPGRWNYPSRGGGRFVPPPPDHSNTQYAILGLSSAQRCGVAVKEEFWSGGIAQFLGSQERDGPKVPGVLRPHAPAAAAPAISSETAPWVRARGFPYTMGGDPTGSMTCAAIGSLAICRGMLRPPFGKGLTPDLSARVDAAVADGFGWLHDHYTVECAPVARGAPPRWLHYYLYALERAGILADVARVNQHDWYADGAILLVLTQEKDGWWTEEPGSDPHKVADTCFALLFLKRAVTAVSGR